jgi:dTDP-4-dehydrorhamnose reductase
VKILVTGADGQLGRELQASCPGDVELLPCGRADLDVTRPDQVATVLRREKPAVVVNAAAYTAVDGAEEETEEAFAVNAEGPRLLARETQQIDARLIHFSTDFVFDGHQGHPYAPQAATAPLCVYGASKLAGERHVLEGGDHRALVIRTSWVYSRYGSNFVKTMLRLMAERDALQVVVDQVGSPTWTGSLAQLVWAFRNRPVAHGLYHWADAGVASWYDFAVAVQEEAATLGLLEPTCQIAPVTSNEYATAARRPAYSVLDTTTTRGELGLAGVHWRRQLRHMLQQWREHGEG